MVWGSIPHNSTSDHLGLEYDVPKKVSREFQPGTHDP